MSKKQKIILLATNMRTAIENLNGTHLCHELFEFPVGCCGDTSILLGAYFQESGLGDFEYICGMKGDHAHAWLEQEDLIVDITGDQFPNGSRVYVGGMNSFYSQFEEDTRQLWSAGLDGNTIHDDRLARIYHEILQEISRMTEVVSSS